MRDVTTVRREPLSVLVAEPQAPDQDGPNGSAAAGNGSWPRCRP